MTRRRYIFNKGEMVEVTADYGLDVKYGLQIVPDIEPYRSMIDGSVITSRSKHRAHLKQHGCLEVGNDTKALQPQYKGIPEVPGLREELAGRVHAKLRYS